MERIMETEPLNILVIEDDPGLLDLVLTLLESKNLGNIDGAENKTQALEKLSSKKYDVLVSDIQLPDGTGKDVVEKLKNENAVPEITLFFTGFSTFTREELMDLGVKDVLMKPEGLPKIFTYIAEFKAQKQAA